jgi:hypothetical protein
MAHVSLPSRRASPRLIQSGGRNAKTLTRSHLGSDPQGLMKGRISHRASNFQAVFVNRSLWHADCFSSGGWHFPGESSVDVTATPGRGDGPHTGVQP